MALVTHNATAQLTLRRSGDIEYDRDRTGWNLAVEHRPALIALPDNESAVAEAVSLAVARDTPIAVRATGHGPANLVDEAVLINTRRLSQVEIDPANATARIAAGVKWDRVIAAAAPYGLAPLVGSTPDVSAVGYLTGGGLPVLGRQYGFSADRIRSFRMVTPDGRIRVVTPGREPDLFWAVRGGKDNFGIVTSVVIDLLPIDRIYGGQLIFAPEQAQDILPAWLQWTRHIDEAMSTSVGLLALPDPQDPKGQASLGPSVHVRVAYTGDPEMGERLVAPLRDLEPVRNTVAEMPYARIGEIHDDPLEPLPVREWGTLLHGLDEEALSRILAAFDPATGTAPGLVEIRLLGGALAREPALPSAIGHRTAAFTLLAATLALPGQPPFADMRNAVAGAVERWDMHAAFPNLLGSGTSEPETVRRAYDPMDYEILASIKAGRDPQNRFRLNHNIPPAHEDQGG
jgi:hypothetical protein